MRSIKIRRGLSWASVVLGGVLGLGVARASAPPILFQHPTVDATRIAFAYADSLWSVPREGGAAQRLTSGERADSEPIFSPDGTRIAFTRSDRGNLDVYVMPASGGMARRLTWHPGADEAVGWTRDGKDVLFRSPRASVDTYPRLFTVPAAGGFPTAVPLPYAEQGSYSPNGERLAYVPFRNHAAFEAWKHYRGGMVPRIRIARLSDSSVVTLPRGGAANKDPMWVGNAIYFLSDRTGGHFRLYRYDVQSRRVTAVSPDDGHDILSATAGALATPHPAIVCAEMGKLFLVDVKSGAVRQVHVALNADFPSAEPHWMTVAHELSGPGISPHGVRAVFQAHGDIVTVPAKYGDAVDITRTPGVAERQPAWSPDGKWIAYFSDASGHYQLYLSPQTGIGAVRKISLGASASFYRQLVWSPDSRSIAFYDSAEHLWIADVATGKLTLVATRYYDEGGAFSPGWSPDSRWLAYSTELPNNLDAIFVYSLASGKSTQVTDGMSDALTPRFDPSGKYLYFLASTNPNPSGKVIELSAIDQPTVYRPYVAVLRRNLPSPLAPRPGNEKAAPEKPSAKADKKSPPTHPKPPKVSVDFAGLSQRILALPMPARAYVDLEVSEPGVLWLAAGPIVQENRPDHPALSLYRFTLKDRKAALVLPAVKAWVLSADGKHLLIEQGSNWRIVSAAAKIPPGGALHTAGLQVYVDPPQQWRQMYHEIWRMERAFFYSPQMNGLNVDAAEKYYARFVPGIEACSGLQYLAHDMLGDLSVSHMFLGVCPSSGPKPISVGLLGADYTIDHDRYRFARIYSGENWNPSLHAPLTQPGVNVTVGDYLLAVDGRPLHGTDDIYAYFQNRAGQQVVLRVGPHPDGTGARDVTVVPVASEAALRKRAWIHRNRLLVDRLSHGQLAYVYLPDTANGGWTYFNRYYFSRIGKQGVIVDERFNHGGDIANYVINELSQPLLNFVTSRFGHAQVVPAAIFGPKVMIENHFAGSGGDWLPYAFKMEHVGTLVGTRTWGGLVGIGGYPPLMNGGGVTAPRMAIYFPDGKWDVENHGVPPDVQVRMDPKLWREGRDPQLEAAVAIALRELKAHPSREVSRPAYPDYDEGTPFARGATAGH